MMRTKILCLVFILLTSHLRVFAQTSSVESFLHKASPTYQAFETTQCGSELLSLELVDSQVINSMCKILVKSEYCSDIESKYKKDCDKEEDFSIIDSAISCLDGVFNSLKDLWNFLKSILSLIIDSDARKKLSSEAKVFFESLSTYFEVEKIKAENEMSGFGKGIRAGIVASKNLIGHIVKKFILEPLKESYDKLSCQNANGKTQSICKLVSDIFLPPAAFLAAIKKGPKFLKAFAKKKSTFSFGNSATVKKELYTLPTVKQELPTVKKELSTVKKIPPVNPRAVEYDLGGIKYYESKPFGTDKNMSYHADSLSMSSRLKPLNGRNFTIPEMKLKSSEVAQMTDLGGGITSSKIVTFKDGSKAVFKPIDKTQMGGWASNYRTEVLAYQIDKTFGFDLVPPTVERTINGQHGSIQKFKQGKIAFDTEFSLVKKDQLDKQSVMDFLIDHRDRHGGNFLVNTNGNITSIDNSLSFTGRGNNYTEIIYKEEAMVRFMTSEEGMQVMSKMKTVNRDNLKKSMVEYIGTQDTDRFFHRLDFLVRYYDRLHQE